MVVTGTGIGPDQDRLLKLGMSTARSICCLLVFFILWCLSAKGKKSTYLMETPFVRKFSSSFFLMLLSMLDVDNYGTDQCTLYDNAGYYCWLPILCIFIIVVVICTSWEANTWQCHCVHLF